MGSTAEAHIVNLPHLSCGEADKLSDQELYNAIETWIREFNNALEAADFTKIEPLIHHDAWLRDLLSMSWDFRTITGQAEITHYFQDKLEASGLGSIQLRKTGTFLPKLKKLPHVEWVEAMFDFETKVGVGSGVVRLVDDSGSWKLFMISFMLQKLKGFGEKTHFDRPHGGNNSFDGVGNWQERRERQKEFMDHDPAVIVVGAGMFDQLIWFGRR